MNPSNKILVVGASLAGPAVCYWLKRFGFSPTLIEKHHEIRKGGYAIDIRGIAVDLAKQMGIYDKCCEMRTQLQSGRYVDAMGNTLFEEEGEKFGFRQGEEVEVVRGDLVQILMDTIPDVPCHFDQSIQDIQQTDDGVTVTFKDGRNEQFDLVIGTDGLHSSTRRLVFNQDEYTMLELGSYICIYTIPNYLKLKHAEIVFEKDQKLAQVNCDKNHDIAHAGFLFRSTHQLKNIRDVAEQKAFLRETFTNLGWETNTLLSYLEETKDFYFDSITQVKMKDWSKGRVTLVGDAGYCASPLSGQGTSLALVGAYILAGELNKAKGDYAKAFKQYHTLMNPFVEANQEFGADNAKTFLIEEDVSEAVAEARLNSMMETLKVAANAITLPQYDLS